MTGRLSGLLGRGLALVVRAYQLIVSPWFGPTCRYYPSCSAYAVTALRRHGAVRGVGLAGWRLLRCNPWSRGGIDHVPQRGEPMPWSRSEARARTLGVAAGGARGHDAPEDL
ncbi:membrane protein insertion efficiency factor YidD [Georgenia satyanarayanai]|uniref:membrane protein insertion efficiency factor YidD n=1 Tax=Georgenia satyanarayanai TaxID=860221 RepID=UPI001264B0DE|nr:membrane protein insertion efficiency factor YidD [Georgenia satyanarayanai]